MSRAFISHGRGERPEARSASIHPELPVAGLDEDLGALMNYCVPAATHFEMIINEAGPGHLVLG